ncbi:MAG: FkbM family methyltransferase [bacterium]|nr:FkbM family methyltransferase [bacterium]
MKQQVYESTQRFFEKTLHLRLHLERIPDASTPVSLGYEDHYVPAIDLTLHLDMDEQLDRSYAQNIVDEDCFDFLREHLSGGGAFVDIGANQGIYSCLVLHESDVQVVAIEPDPYSTAKIRQNVAINSLDSTRLSLFEVAAGSIVEDRELMLNVAGNRAGSSLVVDQRRWTNREENVTITVHCRPLLELLSDADVSQVAVMKIDIEGYEFPVLDAFFRDAPVDIYPKAMIVEAFGHCIPLVGGSTVELLIRQGYHLANHDNYNYFFVWPANLSK